MVAVLYPRLHCTVVVALLPPPVLLFDLIVHNVVEDVSKSSCVPELVNPGVSSMSPLHVPSACSNFTRGCLCF